MHATECIEPYPVILYSDKPLTDNTARISQVVLPEKTTIEIGSPERFSPASHTALILGALGLSQIQCVEIQGPSSPACNRHRAVRNMGAHTLAEATARAFESPRIFMPDEPLTPFDLTEEHLIIAARLARGDRLAGIQRRFELTTDQFYAQYMNRAYKATEAAGLVNFVLLTMLSKQLPPYLEETRLRQREQALFAVDWRHAAGAQTPELTYKKGAPNAAAETAAPAPTVTEELSPALLAEAAAAYAATQETDQLFVMRDRGWYAELLLAFADPHTGEQWADILLHDLARASGSRSTMRSHNVPKLLFKTREDPYTTDPDVSNRYAKLQSRRAFNPALDTPPGRAALVRELYERAQHATYDAGMLRQLQAEGRAALAEAKKRNELLIFFTLNNLPYKGLWRQIGAAYEGMVSAMRGFDPELGFTLSTYTVETIARHVLRARWDDEVWMTEAPKVPGARLGKLSQPYLAAYFDDRPAPGWFVSEDLQEESRAQNALVSAIFEAAGLTAQERDLLRGRFGVSPYAQPSTDAELAAEFGITKWWVGRTCNLATEKIMASPEAAAIFHKYLHAG